MTERIRMLNEPGPEALRTLYQGTLPLAPAPIFTAAAATRLRQVIVTNPSGKPGELDLQVVHSGSGGQPGDDRAQVLTASLQVAPGAVVELIGMTASGYVTLWRGGVLYGCQETPDALMVLAWESSDA